MQNLGKKVWDKVFEILGHLLYSRLNMPLVANYES